jgi:hypothetical protein
MAKNMVPCKLSLKPIHWQLGLSQCFVPKHVYIYIYLFIFLLKQISPINIAINGG